MYRVYEIEVIIKDGNIGNLREVYSNAELNHCLNYLNEDFKITGVPKKYEIHHYDEKWYISIIFSAYIYKRPSLK